MKSDEYDCSMSNITLTTQFSNHHEHRPKRFSRSSSRSHSKSRDEHDRQSINNTYIRSPFQGGDPMSPVHRTSIFTLDQTQPQKREATPASGTRHRKKQKNSPGTDLPYLRLEKRCISLQEENNKKEQMIQQLEQQVRLLEDDVISKMDDNQRLASKLEAYEKKKGGDEPRVNNLQKIRKKIAETKDCEVVVSLEGLQQRIKLLSSENTLLKEYLERKEAALESMEESRQTFLNQLVIDLKGELAEKMNTMENMQTKINVLMLKQARHNDNLEVMKNEEMHLMRIRYEKMAKKFRDTNRQLAALRRSEQRRSGWGTRRERSNSECSFELTP